MRQGNKEIAIETDSIRNFSKNLRHLPSRCRSSRPEVPPGSEEPTFSEKHEISIGPISLKELKTAGQLVTNGSSACHLRCSLVL